MERKPKSVGVVVSAAEIRESLSKAKIAGEEEKALRMRNGISLPEVNAPLPWAASGNAADELLLMEMELMKAQLRRSRAARGRTTPNQLKLEPTAQKARDKIVRALRKKR